MQGQHSRQNSFFGMTYGDLILADQLLRNKDIEISKTQRASQSLEGDNF